MLCLRALPQPYTVEQAWKTLRNGESHDSLRARALNKIAYSYSHTKPDSAILLAEQLLTIAKTTELKKYISKANNTLGIAYDTKGDYRAALDCYAKALQTSRELNDKKATAGAYLNTGLTYFHLSDYPKALDNYLSGLRLSEEDRDTAGISRFYNNIGNLYVSQAEYTKALDYFMKTVRLNEPVHNSRILGTSYDNIGSVYLDKNDSKNALRYYEMSLAMKEETHDEPGKAKCYLNMGNLYGRNHNYKKAADYFFKAREIHARSGDQLNEEVCCYHLADVYNGLKDYKTAIRYADTARNIALAIGDINGERSACFSLAFAYSKTGDYRQAFEKQSRMVDLTDSIFNMENSEKLNSLKTQYEIDKREAEKRDLAQQNEIQAFQLGRNRLYLICTIAALVIVLLMGYLLFRQNRLQNQQREMRLEQKLLRSQMNPHFIFNALQAIQNYILKHDQKEAVKYLSSFANITRSVLENSRMELISLRKEVTLLDNYLQLQKLRFGNRFDYNIHIDPATDTDHTEIPPMLSQPFIENAIEHGMRDIESGGRIDIYFTTKDNSLLLEITDNGTGIQSSDNPQKQHQSLALSITRERVELMNKKQSRKAWFNIGDAFPESAQHKGVKVKFSIPL
ncbi:MAG: tetratricopeptide repeat-containing sensor histidine kinase [Bacteroidia bacterium]